jgi:hypothetical protein
MHCIKKRFMRMVQRRAFDIEDKTAGGPGTWLCLNMWEIRCTESGKSKDGRYPKLDVSGKASPVCVRSCTGWTLASWPGP